MYGGLETTARSAPAPSACTGASMRAVPQLDRRAERGVEQRGVRPRHGERVERDVGRDDASKLSLARERQRDRARSRADVHGDAAASRSCSARSDLVDEHLGLRARDQHALVDVERQVPERRAARPRTRTARRARDVPPRHAPPRPASRPPAPRGARSARSAAGRAAPRPCRAPRPRLRRRARPTAPRRSPRPARRPSASRRRSARRAGTRARASCRRQSFASRSSTSASASASTSAADVAVHARA